MHICVVHQICISGHVWRVGEIDSNTGAKKVCQKKGLASRLNYVRPDEFCALTYRNVTSHFENLKYRRIPYNIITKVTEFIMIDILVC